MMIGRAKGLTTMVLALGSALLAGCAPLPSASRTPAPESTSVTSSPTPTPDPSPTPSNSSAAPAQPLTPSNPASESIIGPPTAGPITLTLAEARRPNDWTEGNYQIPGRQEPLTAMAANVCWSDRELEFRFASQTGKITFEVAQDLDSESSSTTLEFSLQANGRTVDTSRIAFDQSAALSAPLTGVSAVVLSVKRTAGNGCATALVTAATVQP